jgi:hypothetical protein
MTQVLQARTPEFRRVRVLGDVSLVDDLRRLHQCCAINETLLTSKELVKQCAE